MMRRKTGYLNVNANVEVLYGRHWLIVVEALVALLFHQQEMMYD